MWLWLLIRLRLLELELEQELLLLNCTTVFNKYLTRGSSVDQRPASRSFLLFMRLES